MTTIHHEYFDEIFCGNLRFQFFSVALWEWRVRVEPGAIALPMLSIRAY